ncbi:BT4734/BF3469 family protein [Pedobacter helvus]|uniref:BT4734/BF3469 family protein n=1 Tax=Pedobacter helvus TaxID=2563444 RepID=A0ABW9JCF0_9SPHI|nr:BT4734/BF3469 family protein [Pedobacter ureilyticus]
MYNLDTFKCIASPKVESTITSIDWFNQIKESSHIPVIEAARVLKKIYVTTSDEIIKEAYTKLKKTLPTITYNVRFNGYRDTQNVTNATGLMYLDIDQPNFNIELMDKSKIYAYYKSIGGLGWSIIVRVSGLTNDNFFTTFDNIVDDLGISGIVDEDAKGIVRQSVISYDPNLYINESSFIYNSVNEIIKHTQPSINNQKKEEHIGDVGYEIEKPVRFSNIYDFEFDGDYIYNWDEGFAFVNCYLPTRQLHDKRKRTLLAYLNNLIWLNPNIQYYHALNILTNANKTICLKPLPIKILEGMLKSILKQKNENRLKPHITIRRILFAPHNTLQVVDKLNICGRLIKAKWEQIGCLKLNGIIEDWDFNLYGKISIATISQNHPMDKKTVAKYYHYFKDLIAGMNQDYKQSKYRQDIDTLLLECFKKEAA